MTDFLPRRITIVARNGKRIEQTSSDEGLWQRPKRQGKKCWLCFEVIVFLLRQMLRWMFISLLWCTYTRRMNQSDLLTANWVNTVMRDVIVREVALPSLMRSRSLLLLRRAYDYRLDAANVTVRPVTNDGCKWPTSTYIGAGPGIYLARYPGLQPSVSVFTSSTLTRSAKRIRRRRRLRGGGGDVSAGKRWLSSTARRSTISI